jgi:hypothetical protein
LTAGDVIRLAAVRRGQDDGEEATLMAPRRTVVVAEATGTVVRQVMAQPMDAEIEVRALACDTP